MPVPGPRTQRGPLPGYRNPEGREPDFINLWEEPRPIVYAGRTPGTMVLTLRGMRLAAGQVRRLYKQSVNEIAPAGPYNQVTMAPTYRHPGAVHTAIGVSTGWRYMISSRYLGAGDHSESWGAVNQPLHTQPAMKHVNPTPTLGAGNKSRGRPTVRNRLTSFGSRVPAINSVLPASSNAPGE